MKTSSRRPEAHKEMPTASKVRDYVRGLRPCLEEVGVSAIEVGFHIRWVKSGRAHDKVVTVREPRTWRMLVAMSLAGGGTGCCK